MKQDRGGEKVSKNITEKNIMETILDPIYNQAISGLPGSESAHELAKSYISEGGTKEEQANSLIRWQIAKCATSGFLTGLGGLITLPVAIPANLASVIYVQLRMSAAIAYMGGYDPKNDKVKTFVYLCLCGNAAKDVVKDSLAVPLGKALAIAAINKVPREVIKTINRAVGLKLVTKFGEKGVINLGKAVPLLGGVISGTMDGVTTNVIGDKAKEIFLTNTNDSAETKRYYAQKL